MAYLPNKKILLDLHHRIASDVHWKIIQTRIEMVFNEKKFMFGQLVWLERCVKKFFNRKYDFDSKYLHLRLKGLIMKLNSFILVSQKRANML